MKNFIITFLSLVLLGLISYFGYKYYQADDLKNTENVFVPAIKTGPKPSFKDENGRIFSHPDNAIYNLDKN